MPANHTIDGVIVLPLLTIPDRRGQVMHMLRRDSPLFRTFGEVYFSMIHPGSVKAWKRHQQMTQHFSVPVGAVRVVLFDDRADSPTCGVLQLVETGENNYCLVKVPPLVWYGFKAISNTTALIANCTDMPHDPTEVERRDPSEGRVPYHWDVA